MACRLARRSRSNWALLLAGGPAAVRVFLRRAEAERLLAERADVAFFRRGWCCAGAPRAWTKHRHSTNKPATVARSNLRRRCFGCRCTTCAVPFTLYYLLTFTRWKPFGMSKGKLSPAPPALTLLYFRLAFVPTVPCLASTSRLWANGTLAPSTAWKSA